MAQQASRGFLQVGILTRKAQRGVKREESSPAGSLRLKPWRFAFAIGGWRENMDPFGDETAPVLAEAAGS